jgi:SP family facilitated glucose transporter-like MFS transporter 1
VLYGLGGMVIFHLCLTVAFCYQVGFKYGNGVTPPGLAAVISSVLLLAFYAIGPGPMPWVMVPELFTQGPRAPAVSLAVAVNRISNAIIGYTFLFVLDNLSPYAMILFAGVSGALWLFLYLFLPETKGKTVGEIAEHFGNTPS